jgi:SAM-dependent methyltransferase
MLDPDVESFVVSALPPSPARVLEVGAGSGELADALDSAGYEVVAIDPRSDAPGVIAVALHEVAEPPASFDAAVAVVSLHHVEPLAESCRRLAELLRPGGTLVLDEFDVDRLDEDAARWWLDQRRTSGDDDRHRREPAEVIADMRHHIHRVSTLRAELEEWFELGEPAYGPYLYRWWLPPGLRPAEESLIAAGRVPATGVRIVGTRRAP